MNLEEVKKHLDLIQHSINELNTILSGASSSQLAIPVHPVPAVVTKTAAVAVSKPAAPSFRELDGVIGIFNGVQMVSDDGKNHEVPANYAAKSKLVYGDKLKMVSEDGKNIFKHITKVPRQRVEGMLSKKDNKWYFVSDSGSYEVSSVAADFQRAAEGDEAVALLPEDLTNVTFATLDKVVKPKPQEMPVKTAAPSTPSEKPKPSIPTDFNPRQLIDDDLR